MGAAIQDAVDRFDPERDVRRPLFACLVLFVTAACIALALMHGWHGRRDQLELLLLALGTTLACAVWARRRQECAAPLRCLVGAIYALLAWVTLQQGTGLPAAAWWLSVLPFILASAALYRSAIAGVLGLLAIVVLFQLAPGFVAAWVPPEPVVEPWRHVAAVLGSETAALALIMLAMRHHARSVAALGQARAAAAAAADEQARFVAMLSHEIRTPLGGIVGTAELLDNPQLPEAQRQRLSAMQRRSARALMVLVNDVLELARLDAGRVEIERQPLSLRAILFEANELFSVQAFGKSIELTSSCAAQVPVTLLGDPTRLRQIVHNLVGNAVKFTVQGGVHLRADIDGGVGPAARLRIAVSDSGPGMDAAQQARLFERFEQTDAAVARRHGGSGLGLHLAQQLARLMGGEIEVASAPGQGSVFTLVLPLVAQALAGGGRRLRCANVLLACASEGLERHMLSLFDELGAEALALRRLPNDDEAQGAALLVDAALLGTQGSAWVEARRAAGQRIAVLAPLGVATPAGVPVLLKPVERSALRHWLAGSAASADAAPQRPAPRLLLVDDNPVNQVVVQAMLAQIGASCQVASDAESALPILADGGIDVVLMDLQLPGIDGIGATRRIREGAAGSALRRVPVFALSGSDDAATRAACRAAGMDGFLGKPCTLDMLRRLLAPWLEGTPNRCTTGA